MGKDNRARRVARAKAKVAGRSRAAPHGRPGTDSRPPRQDGPATAGSPAELVGQLLDLACHGRASGDRARVERAEVELCRLPLDLVRGVVAGELCRVVAMAWANGWQPVELVRQVRRNASGAATELTRAAIAADHAHRPVAGLDPRWIEQLAALALPSITASSTGRWVEQWAARLALGVFAEVEALIETVQQLRYLPALEELIPPPGGATRRAHASSRNRATSSDVDRAVLDKIRALLSKAESTTFEAEAEAFTAKAHELMTRHAIEAALLAGSNAAAGGPDRDAPGAIRVAIDDPYADAKSRLLHVVASAGRCRAVFFRDLSMSSVVGFAADLTAVEMLYTSLVVQSHTSLTNAARQLPAGARQRTRSFRSSFLLAYATRIGERLASVADEVIADAESTSGPALLPVLLGRRLAVDESVEQRYGPLRAHRARGGLDGAGWRMGREAADEATLAAGALPASDDEHR